MRPVIRGWSSAPIRFVSIWRAMVWFAVVPLAGGVAAQDATKDVRRTFRAASDPTVAFDVRSGALDGVERVDDQKLTDALIRAWVQCEAEAEPFARRRAERLGRGRGKLVMSERAALDALRPLQSRIQRLLAASRAAAARRVFELVVVGRKLPLQLRVATCVATERAGDVCAELMSTLEGAKRPDDAWVALRALAALGARGAPAHEAIAVRLEDRSRTVRLRAARTLAAVGHRPSAEALIDLLDDVEGRERDAVLAALEALTTLALGPASASWRAWWQVEGEAFVRDGPRRTARSAPAPQSPESGRGYYFGLPQDGKSILYVIDRSQSMRRPVAGRKAGGVTRWQRCVDELSKALEQLGPRARFNIVAFADDIQRFSDSMSPADDDTVASAKDWLGGLKLQLHTNVYDALEYAFVIGGPNLRDRYFEAAADTMFVLSDGLPTVRLPDRPNRPSRDSAPLILDAVQRWNPFGSVVIHTVALGRGADANFLRDLASQNGGRSTVHRD